MEEREHSSKTGLKYFILFISNLKVFEFFNRSHCENYKWNKGAVYFCGDHGKSLCSIWYFVLHFECRWEGTPSKESVQECMAFVKTLMKTITKCDNEGNEKQNDQDISGWQRYFHKQLSSIDEKVINDRMKTLEY